MTSNQPLKMNYKIIRLAFFLFLFPLALVLEADWLIYTMTMDKHQTLQKGIELQYVEKAQQTIANELATSLMDLTYLAAIHESEDIFAGNITQNLEDTFTALIYNRQHYDQIRYLDHTGQEVFRVNNHAGSPRITPPEKLQFKGNRYYFTESIGLDLDELYISPLDLNMEHGAIEVPFKPVLRMASSVVNSDGSTIGVLIINYLGKHILQAISKITDKTETEMMLLNNEGYWLRGASRDKEWGFMPDMPVKPAFSKSYPAEWNHIQATYDG